MAKDKTIIFGKHPVLEALQSHQTFDKIMVQRGLKGNFEEEIMQLGRAQEVPIQYVPREKLNRMTGGNHQGIIGFLSLVQYFKLEQVVPGLFEQSQNPLILLLDGITDVRNFGAIARTAECMGCHALVVAARGAAQINADAVKSSAGALMHIPVCREPNMGKALEVLQLSGIHVLASDLSATVEIDKIDFSVPSAIILGSEGKGIHPSIRQQVDKTFIIPQVGKTDSLNVSVAAGVILYEVQRQRQNVK